MLVILLLYLVTIVLRLCCAALIESRGSDLKFNALGINCHYKF